MQKLRKCLPALTERSRLMLLLTLSCGFVGQIATRLNYTCVTLVLVPWAFALIIGAMRRRELPRNASVWATVGMTAVFVLSAAVNANADWLWVYTAWMLFVQTFLGMLPPEDSCARRTELLAVGSAFTFAFLPFALIALCSVFSGHVIRLPGVNFAVGIQNEGLVDDRIYVLMHPNLAARYAVLSALFSLYAIARCRKPVVRALHALVFAVNVLVLVHTQSRTCLIAFSLAVGILAFRYVRLALGKQLWKLLPAVAAAIVVSLGLLEGLNSLFKLDVRLARQLVPQATTVLEEISRVDSVGQFDVMSTGRGEIWLPALRYLWNNPRYLLTGVGHVENVVELIYQTDPTIFPATHLHNTYLECLARGGILHLLFVLVFLCSLVRPALRVLTQRENGNSRGDCLLPVFIAAMLFMSLPEKMLFVDPGVANLLFFLLCGHLLHADRTARSAAASGNNR